MSTLDPILEVLTLGIADRDLLASRAELPPDELEAYLEFGRWLGFLDGERIALTETGRQYVGDLASRASLLRRSIGSTPLACRAIAEETWPEAPERAISDVLARSTDLDDEAIAHRAEGLADLMSDLDTFESRDEPTREDVRTSLPDVTSMPIAILGRPPALDETLERMGLERVGDVLDLDLETLRRDDTLDEDELDHLAELRDEARECRDTEPDVLFELGRALLRAEADLDRNWRDVFVQLPTRAESGLDTLGLETAGEVITAVLRGDLTNLRGIGPGTVRAVREQFDVILEHDYDYYLYGPGGRPETVSALADRMLDSLDEEDRTILEMRYLEGQTFEEIGEHFDLTRQRIRQKTQDYLHRLNGKYGHVAEELTASLLEALDAGPGLIHRNRVERLTGCNDLYQVLLVVLLNDEDAYLWHDHFIADVPSSTLERGVIAQYRRGISNAHVMRVSLGEGAHIARERGLQLDSEGVRDLIEAVWDLEVDARGTFLNRWANKGDRIARVLQEARQPLDLASIAERYQQDYATDTEAEATPRRVQPFVKKHPDVYTIDNGEYIHRDALPLTSNFLDRVVAWCVERLRGETSAVSVKVLLEKMRDSDLALESDLEGLNWYLLRDALLRHPDITGFHNTFNVAWEPTYEYEGVTLLDRVESILREADEPLAAEDVVDTLPEDFEVNPHSVENYLISQPFSIKIDAHTYMHRDSLDLDDEQIEALVDAAVEELPEDGSVASTKRLVDDFAEPSTFESFVRRDDAAAVLWGLLRHDERTQVGTRLLVARDAGRHDVLLERAILDTVEQIGPAYPREIDDALDTKFGFDVPDSRVYRHARELADQGELRRFPNGLYFSVGIDRGSLFESLERRHDEITRAARRADMVRYPAGDLWMLARYLHHTEQFEAARRVLEVLRQKEGADAFEGPRGDLYAEVLEHLEGSEQSSSSRQSAE